MSAALAASSAKKKKLRQPRFSKVAVVLDVAKGQTQCGGSGFDP